MIGPEFRAELAGLGLEQAEFAAYTGYHTSAVFRWASGARAVPSWVPVLLALLREVRALRSCQAR